MGLYQGSFLNTCVIDSAKDLDDANYRNWIQNENNWDKSTLYCGNSTGSRYSNSESLDFLKLYQN